MPSQDHSSTRSDLNREELLLRLRLDPSMYAELLYTERNDEEIALVAVVNKLDNYIQVPDRLKQSKEFLLSVLDGCIQNKEQPVPDEAKMMFDNGGNMWFWNAVPDKFKDEEGVCIKLLEAWTGIDFPLWRLSEKMRDNFNVAKQAIKSDPQSFRNFGDKIKSNVELASLAMIKYPLMYSYADSEIKKDGSLIEAVFGKSINLFFDIDERFSSIHEETKASINKFLNSLPKKNNDFYMAQFESIEELTLLIMAIKDFPVAKASGSIANRKAMRLIVDHLSEQKVRSLVGNTRTTLGEEIVADAVFKMDVADILKKTNVKIEKKRKLNLM